MTIKNLHQKCGLVREKSYVEISYAAFAVPFCLVLLPFCKKLCTNVLPSSMFLSSSLPKINGRIIKANLS